MITKEYSFFQPVALSFLVLGLIACSGSSSSIPDAKIQNSVPENQIDGNIVYLSSQRLDYGKPNYSREKYYAYLLDIIKRKFPEDDAISSAKHGQIFFFARPLGNAPMPPGKHYEGPQDVPGFVPPGLETNKEGYASVQKVCPTIKYLEGMGSDAIEGEAHTLYLREADAYMERWNRTLLTLCTEKAVNPVKQMF